MRTSGGRGLYREGLLVQFHQNARGIVRGSMLRVTQTEDNVVTAVDAKGRNHALSLNQPERFQVFEEEKVRFAAGDRIRITRNGDSADGRRLNNGDHFTIEKIRKNGVVILDSGAELRPDHGHWTHGYCSTSHSSQSKSVRDVLVAQSTKSFVASSCEQFYVSVSRGKQTVRIYTDDLRGLKEAVGLSSARLSGMELAGLNAKDVSEMSAALNSREWREHIRSRAAMPEGSHAAKEKLPQARWQDQVRSRAKEGNSMHRENLQQQRKGSEPRKGEVIQWQDYVKMRRQNAGADGRNRSRGKGSPHAPGPKKPEERLKELQRKPEPKPESPAKKATPKKKADARNRSAEAKTESSAKNFQRTSAGKKKGEAKLSKDSRSKGLKPSTLQQAAKRKARTRKQGTEMQKTRKPAKIKQNTPVVKPPAPRK
jgi:hypothetical protein